MNRPKILLTRRLPDACMIALEQQSDLVFHNEDRALDRSELIESVHDVDGLLCLLSDTIDEEVFSAGKNLRVVSNYAVGFNNIDVAEATSRGIAVTNTPGVLTEATADIAFALLMASARRIVEGDELVRSGNWHGWEPLQLLGGDISGKTLGLVGLGRIGRAMIPRAKGFSMNVVYWNRTRLSPQEEEQLGIDYFPLNDLLGTSDYVSLHVALTDSTKHLIDADALKLMKPTSYLINTARGAVVDEAALVQAIESSVIAGAGLDVFEREPEIASGLMKLKQVVMAPHLGSATTSTREKMGEMAVADCFAACRGERPVHLVNPEITDSL